MSPGLLLLSFCLPQKMSGSVPWCDSELCLAVVQPRWPVTYLCLHVVLCGCHCRTHIISHNAPASSLAPVHSKKQLILLLWKGRWNTHLCQWKGRFYNLTIWWNECRSWMIWSPPFFFFYSVEFLQVFLLFHGYLGNNTSSCFGCTMADSLSFVPECDLHLLLQEKIEPCAEQIAKWSL